MAKVLTDNKHYTDIADAIRAKNGTDNTYKPSEMADAIEAITTGGSDVGLDDFIPEEAFAISGDCGYRFSSAQWNWFLDMYGDKITTQNISVANHMFFQNSRLENIRFDFNFDYPHTNYNYVASNYMFNGCWELTTCGKLINWYPQNTANMFQNCYKLRELPEFVNPNFSRVQAYQYSSNASMFLNCYSLRAVPQELLKEFYGMQTSISNCFLGNAFQNCYVLDEVIGAVPKTGTLTTNIFSGTFSYCSRIKNIIFAMQDDGTPYSANWKSQNIDLSSCVGYASRSKDILDYNSGITADKEVTDDATYQALKDDPDWFTLNMAYSRYNHDSAVATINSLPNVTASGGTNTIKFNGAAGSTTDGGAINTLTEEEIAVAAAKGWTVTFA